MTAEDKDTAESGGSNVYYTTYTWDGNGNLTDKDVDDQTVANEDEAWDYGYDYYYRLTDVDKDASDYSSYTYNYLGNRVQKYVNSGSATTKYFSFSQAGAWERVKRGKRNPQSSGYIILELIFNISITVISGGARNLIGGPHVPVPLLT